MEPANKNPVKIEQSSANTTIHVQMPEEKAGFFRRVWSVVTGIFSYIGHRFATLFHLGTTKKTEDIKAEHPVQGKPAATSDKVVGQAKTVPPLGSGTLKTETPPPAPKKEDAPPPPAKTVPPLNTGTGTQKTETPPPAPPAPKQEAPKAPLPASPPPPPFSKATFLEQNADEIRQYYAEFSSLNRQGKTPSTIEDLLQYVDRGYRLYRNEDLRMERVAFIESHNRDINAIMMNFVEFEKLFHWRDDSLLDLQTWRNNIQKLLFNDLRANKDSPTMTRHALLFLVQGMQKRYRLKDDDIQLLEQLKDAKWRESEDYPPPNFIQWVITMAIEESKVALPKTLDEELDAFFAFNERMNKYEHEYTEMYTPLRKENPSHAARVFASRPFSEDEEISRLVTWMRDYHIFDPACPRENIPVNPEDYTKGQPLKEHVRVDKHFSEQQIDENRADKYLLPHQLVWKPAEGQFYARLGNDKFWDSDKGDWFEVEEKLISDLNHFIGASYVIVESFDYENEEEENKIEKRQSIRIDEVNLNPNSYTGLKVAFNPAVLKEMLQKFRAQKQNRNEPQKAQ